MSYHSILVHVDDSPRCTERLDVAARLARTYDAELIGVYAVPTLPMTPSLSAMLPDTMVEHRLEETGEAQERAEGRFRAAASRVDLPFADWRAPAGDAIPVLVMHAHCTDLIVIGQRDPEAAHRGFQDDLATAMLMQSGRPVLVVPYAFRSGTFGETAVVAWNGSRESARAVADAMPLLARASRVHVLSIVEDDEDAMGEKQADARVAAWLRLHGIDPVVRHYDMPGTNPGELILSQVADLGADLLVMGAYSHSRLQERVMGGVTRLMLEQMTLPVLMTH